MIRKFLLLLIVIFCGSVCFCEEAEKVDLKTAIDLALQNNINQYKKDVEIAENNIKVANRLQNPTIKNFWNFGTACKGNPNQIGLAQTIELFKRIGRKNLAKANYEIAVQEYENKKFQLEMNVAEAYVKLVVAKSLLKKCERQRAFHEKLLKMSNISQKEKSLDIIEAKIALNQIINEVNKAKANEKSAMLEFNKVINSLNHNYDSIDTEITKNNNIKGINIPSSAAKLPNFKDIEDTAIENRLDIKIAKSTIDAANKNLTVVIRQRVPDLEVTGGYGFQPGKTSDSGNFESGAYLEACIVNIPILYTYRPEIRNAKLEIEKANLNYLSVVNQAKKDIEIAYEKFLTAQLNLESYNDSILKDSEELFTLFEKMYKEKPLDFASLAAVEESYQDLIVGYSEALSDYYLGWIDFLRETNSKDFTFDKENL